MSATHTHLVPAGRLRGLVAGIFETTGLPARAAATVAEALVDADLRGIPSHGVMLVPMYVERLRAGSVSPATEAAVAVDFGAIAVLDAGHALGILTGDQAMALAQSKAGAHGVGLVAVRHAFHFGGAFRYVQHAARNGFIGLAAANTRPLMPAPGGAEAVVGNNPLAIGVPRAGAGEIVLDMALSEAALGKIRLAAQEGHAIPPTWATDASGAPTTDPHAALAGLLLPAGGPKGYGLAFMIDVLTGVLSGGGSGAAVQGLYADVTQPNDCAHVFLAIDPRAFGDPVAFGAAVAALARQVTGSATAPGFERVYLPGEPEAERHARASTAGIAVPESVLGALRELGGGSW